MKTLFMILLTLGTLTAFAGPKASCKVIPGPYDNSALKLHGPVIIDSFGEEGFDEFSLMKVEELTINLFGKDELFGLKATSVSRGTKLDFFLKSNPEQVKAVLLTDKSPARARKNFNALLVITGAGIDFTQNNVPVYSASSLVYNLKCK